MRPLAVVLPLAAILASPLAAQQPTRTVVVPPPRADSARADTGGTVRVTPPPRRDGSGTVRVAPPPRLADSVSARPTSPVQTRVDASGRRVTTPERSGGAHAPGTISTLRFYVRTGRDDLRRESKVKAFLLLHDGRRVESPVLNCEGRVCAPLARGLEATWEWDVPAGSRLRPEDIHRVGLSFATGRRLATDAPDGWDLARITVEYVLPAGDEASGGRAVTRRLVERAGDPAHRFHGHAETSWEVPRGREPVRATRRGS